MHPIIKKIALGILPKNISEQLNGGLSLLRQARFKGDGMLTIHNVDFLHDPVFMKCFAAALEDIPEALVKNVFSSLQWRAHVCCWAANQAMNVKGDFVECGVWYGVLSKTILEYTNFSEGEKDMYLLDPWGGLVLGESDSYVPDIYNEVKKSFSKYSNVHLIRGLIPETLTKVPSEKIAYLSIDMNGVEPERCALEFFYPKIVPGGIIYFDDYAWAGHSNLKKMIDEFFKDKPETILYIASGQGIVIKC